MMLHFLRVLKMNSGNDEKKAGLTAATLMVGSRLMRSYIRLFLSQGLILKFLTMCTFPISDNSLLRRDLKENFPAFSFDCFFVDCFCTIRIVDESNPSSGISINVFAETFEKLPHVESTGDIIQFSPVVVFPSVTLLMHQS